MEVVDNEIILEDVVKESVFVVDEVVVKRRENKCIVLNYYCYLFIGSFLRLFYCYELFL